MENQTKQRIVARLVNASKAIDKQLNRTAFAVKAVGVVAQELGIACLRPTNKVLDATAKIMEAYASFYGATADVVEDIAEVIPKVQEVVTSHLDSKGYWKRGEFPRLLEEATKRPPLKVVAN
jgi:hypothetical protein